MQPLSKLYVYIIHEMNRILLLFLKNVMSTKIKLIKGMK